MNSINGYSLFREIEDDSLRKRNQAIMIANIIEDHIKPSTGKLNQAGLYYSLQYWEEVDEKDRQDVYAQVETITKERGLLA